MDLLPFATALLGGVLVIAGGFVNQWWASRRDSQRDQRLKDQEHAVWARERRYLAHQNFLASFDDRYRLASDAKDDFSQPEPPEDFLVPLYSRLSEIRLVCSKPTVELAEIALETLREYTYSSNEPWAQVEYRLDLYLGAIREELDLPPIRLMGDP